jgi:hypothetical protein
MVIRVHGVTLKEHKTIPREASFHAFPGSASSLPPRGRLPLGGVSVRGGTAGTHGHGTTRNQPHGAHQGGRFLQRTSGGVTSRSGSAVWRGPGCGAGRRCRARVCGYPEECSSGGCSSRPRGHEPGAAAEARPAVSGPGAWRAGHGAAGRGGGGARGPAGRRARAVDWGARGDTYGGLAGSRAMRGLGVWFSWDSYLAECTFIKTQTSLSSVSALKIYP